MSSSSQKKNQQLGMNHSTANGRLNRDLLWNFVKSTGADLCCKCSKPMCRDTFSVEHVIPWLDSEDPVGLFFDISNIKYSHIRCNISDARRVKKYETPDDRNKAKRKYDPLRVYCPVKRKEQYKRHGR